RMGLALEAGQNDSYWVAQFNDDKTRVEAEGFEARKKQAQGLHFLAIQKQLGSQEFSGVWLLQEWGYQ
ncbi:MAG: Tab2 family RNA-binding protein, partial [Cyanophyceae cyanobacterium]